MVLDSSRFPEINTFSSVIRYSICMEEAAEEFYQKAAELRPEEAEALGALAAKHRERNELLVETRQQKLNEMILEPVSDLERDEYLPDVEISESGQVKAKALALEDLGARFYGDLAKVSKELSREAAKVYKRLAKLNGKLQSTVERLG